MSNISGRAQRLLPDRSVWTTSMVWWHAGFYSALVSVAYFVLFARHHDSGTPLVIGGLAVLGAAYPFLTRRQDLRTGRSALYVVVLVFTVSFLAFFYDGTGVLLFVAFPQIWMFTASQRQGVIATAVLCLGVAAGLISRSGLTGAGIFGISAQLVTSFVASCMIGLWISKVIEQSEQRAELLAELETTRHELNKAEQARGALAERERMAREIHDTLAQGFTSIAMLSEAAQAQLRTHGGSAPDLALSLAAISETARDNLAEARDLVSSGVPSNVKGGDLLAALRRLPASMRLGDIRLTVELPEALPPLSSTQQVALLRTAQEALNNVRKHSGAACAQVRVELLTDGEPYDGGTGDGGTGDGGAGSPAAGRQRLQLTVIDDGIGFNPTVEADGFGLKSMAKRLQEINGQLHIATSAGGGTRLSAVVPVRFPAGPSPASPTRGGPGSRSEQLKPGVSA